MADLLCGGGRKTTTEIRTRLWPPAAQSTGCAGGHTLQLRVIPNMLWQGICRQESARVVGAVGAKPAFITPGSPWENGSCDSFNASFRDEVLNGEVFTTLREAQILIERWRRHYNTVRPHSALGYRPPAPKSIVPINQSPTMH